ncbi:MAG TPA: hypothetical protein VKR43_21340 [Bryobacteraceae bacterium]|nr:hypothetical protein [Bryobacteraceae bacterium]
MRPPLRLWPRKRLFFAALLICHAAFAQPQAGKAGKGDDAFFTGAPFSLNDLLQRVGVIADKRLAIAIERRGVSFSPTQADLDKLKQAGASEELLLRIRVKAPPPKVAPPPPKPALAGPMTLQCTPGDCEIAVNGKPRGTTARGVLVVDGLPAGDTVIDFKKDGFEGQQLSVTARANAASSHSVRLKPTAAHQASLGKDLLAKMTEKLGGASAFQQASGMTASGNAVLVQSGGQKTEWKVLARLKLPKMSYLEINANGMKWWDSLSGADIKAEGSKQMRGGPVAGEMEKLTRLYRDYQPAMLVQRLQTMRLTAPDGVAEPSGAWLLHAAAENGSLDVFLTPEYTPMRVVSESATGVEVLYADYAIVQKAWYPKSMTMKFTDALHSFEIHFNQVRFDPKLSDRELHR